MVAGVPKKKGRIGVRPRALRSETVLPNATGQYLLQVNVSSVQLPTVARLAANARS